MTHHAAGTLNQYPNLIDLMGRQTGLQSPEEWWGLTIGSDELTDSVDLDPLDAAHENLLQDEIVSDSRLKAGITQVGTTAHGLPLYNFRYIGRTEVYEGVMAQDVLKVMPSAVSCGADGYYRVKYKDLGLQMRRVA